jgi:hypothetical protein
MIISTIGNIKPFQDQNLDLSANLKVNSMLNLRMVLIIISFLGEKTHENYKKYFVNFFIILVKL